MASRQPQPGRWLAACLVVIALLYVGVAVGGSWTPKLGLDLEGGASAVFTPTLPAGHKVTQAQLNQSVDVIRTRVNGIGVSEAQVSVVGGNIEVDVPGKNSNQLIDLIGTTAQLRFRQVIAQIPVSQTTPTTTTSATPTTTTSGTATPATAGTPTGSTSASAAASATSAATTSAAPVTSAAATTAAPAVIKPKPSTTANGRVLSQALLAAAATSAAATGAPAATSAAGTSPGATTGAAASVTPAATPAASGTAAPAATGAAAAATPAASATPAQTTGPCLKITLTTSLPTGCTTANVQKQITALGNCRADKLNAAEALGLDDPAQPIAACERSGTAIDVLAPAYMEGSEVKNASSVDDSQQGWLVQLNFNGKGSSDFGKLTTAVTSLTSPLNQVAVVLDGVVESAPVIQQAILGGSAQITGGSGSAFTQAQTDSLAQILNFGSLPVTLKQQTVEEISPTLGSDQLDGGLIAGGIGLGLVLVYSLLYYRGLGLVTIASLGVSAITTYASVTFLGYQIGYRLSLAGIAGFIVAVGITADSFVVYFERLRDEVREGRTLRSGAERAWVRARRTIISADTVSLLAAAILYWLSVGNVRGFAFTLGLSTITDLFVVFFFTKPLISLLARTKLYGSGGSFSGLGRQRVLGSNAASVASTVRPAAKEA